MSLMSDRAIEAREAEQSAGPYVVRAEWSAPSRAEAERLAAGLEQIWPEARISYAEAGSDAAACALSDAEVDAAGERLLAYAEGSE